VFSIYNYIYSSLSKSLLIILHQAFTPSNNIRNKEVTKINNNKKLVKNIPTNKETHLLHNNYLNLLRHLIFIQNLTYKTIIPDKNNLFKYKLNN
jgi:hypothetical protein